MVSAQRAVSADEKFRLGAVGGVVLGLVGLGVGAAVDRAISRRTVLYARSPRAGTMAISVAPGLTPTRASLRITAAWYVQRDVIGYSKSGIIPRLALSCRRGF